MNLITKGLTVIVYIFGGRTWNGLRSQSREVSTWVNVPLHTIPAEKKAEAYRRAFDSKYSKYDPVGWWKDL